MDHNTNPHIGSNVEYFPYALVLLCAFLKKVPCIQHPFFKPMPSQHSRIPLNLLHPCQKDSNVDSGQDTLL